MCVCVCVCVCVSGARRSCFDCILYFCFVMVYVLQFGEIARKRVQFLNFVYSLFKCAIIILAHFLCCKTICSLYGLSIIIYYTIIYIFIQHMDEKRIQILR